MSAHDILASYTNYTRRQSIQMLSNPKMLREESYELVAPDHTLRRYRPVRLRLYRSSALAGEATHHLAERIQRLNHLS